MNDYIIEVKRVTHVFKDEDGRKNEAIRDVSFSVKQGEFFTILGPSGCGKSTLLRILTRMIQPSHGEILFSDHVKPEQVAMIFQSFAIFPWLTVYENVEFGLKMRGVADDKRKETTEEHINEMGLSGFENSYPKDLSGGMKQRVGMARALAMNPKILFMDEAFSALDAFTAQRLREDVLNLWLKDKITIIMVTHAVEEALEMSDRILVMTPHPGRVEAVLDIDLPRPRPKRSEDFFRLSDKIYEIVKL